MGNLAETVKKQTDRILRQRALNRTEGVVVSGVSSGTGAPAPVVNSPVADLTAHKVSGDHDGRYYTEAEINGLLAALTYPGVMREIFANVSTVVVEHNLGAHPIVQVIGQVTTAYGAGNFGAGAYGGIDGSANVVLTPSSIAHNSINQVTVTLSAAATGEVVCIG